MDTRPIPAFYCCYLLRSTVRHANLYIGSTPNPVRRLRQHNGFSNGGAAKTARDTLRPWEMACIVTGFPSSVAALQFEWAWQNTHLTRRIAEDQRITIRETRVRTSPKTGRTRRRPVRPRASLTNLISNLHLLLRVPSFARWPLEVRFFREDVYRVWQRWAERSRTDINHETKVSLDIDPSPDVADEVQVSGREQSKHGRPAVGRTGLEGLNVTYAGLKSHLEKGIFLLAESEGTSCAICTEHVDEKTGMVVVCPVSDCRAASHITCLSSRFLGDQSLVDPVIPKEGPCPKCNGTLQWVDLVKELSLRIRGKPEIEKLMKKPRVRKSKAAPTDESVSISMASRNDSTDTEEDLQISEEDTVPELRTMDVASIIPSDDGWQYQVNEDDDIISMTSTRSDTPGAFRAGSLCRSPRQGAISEIVIEESDWDYAEILS